MASEPGHDFAHYLRIRNHLAGATQMLSASASTPEEPALQQLWKLTDLSASDFADEVAVFFKHSRIALPELMAAPTLANRFSRRFLREMQVFPFQTADGSSTLAMADPENSAALRAASIVLGGTVEIAVASFEDIETVLDRRLGQDDASPQAEDAAPVRDDDIESLRDLASGAPVVRAVNEILEKAVELRASDIHIEPFRSGLTVRLRIDGLLRAIPAPAGALPQAIISRVKILSGLNIAERRLPQDGAARLNVAAIRTRYPRRHHADPAWRVRRNPPVAEGPRSTADREARLYAP